MNTFNFFVVALVMVFATRSAAADDPPATVFANQCAVCHGPDGKGQSVMGKKLNMKDWSDGKTLNGMSDGDVGKEIHAGKQLMPAFTQLTGAQISAIVAYIRSFQK